MNTAPGLGKTLGLFTAFFLGLTLLLSAILWALDAFAGYQMQTGSIGWMPPIVGAMSTGQSWAIKAKEKPTGKFAWIASLGFVVVTVLASIAVMYLITVGLGMDVFAELRALYAEISADADGPQLFFAILAGVFLVLWLLLRFAFSFGASTALKNLARSK